MFSLNSDMHQTNRSYMSDSPIHASINKADKAPKELSKPSKNQVIEYVPKAESPVKAADPLNESTASEFFGAYSKEALEEMQLSRLESIRKAEQLLKDFIIDL